MVKFEREKPIRRVSGIYEIREDTGQPFRIFSYNERIDKLEVVYELEDTDTFKRIAKFFGISISDVYELYIDICEALKQNLDINCVERAASFFTDLYKRVLWARWKKIVA